MPPPSPSQPADFGCSEVYAAVQGYTLTTRGLLRAASPFTARKFCARRGNFLTPPLHASQARRRLPHLLARKNSLRVQCHSRLAHGSEVQKASADEVLRERARLEDKFRNTVTL